MSFDAVETMKSRASAIQNSDGSTSFKRLSGIMFPSVLIGIGAAVGFGALLAGMTVQWPYICAMVLAALGVVTLLFITGAVAMCDVKEIAIAALKKQDKVQGM